MVFVTRGGALIAVLVLALVGSWPRDASARSMRILSYPGDVKPRVVTIEEAQRFKVPKALRLRAEKPVVAPGSISFQGGLVNTTSKPVEVVVFPVESAYPLYLQLTFTKRITPKPTAGPRRPPRPPRPQAFTVPGNAQVVFRHRLDCSAYLYRGTPTAKVTWTFHYWNPPKPTGTFTVRLPSPRARAAPAPAPVTAAPKAAPAPRRRITCESERWGGWTGKAKCRRASRRLVRGKHRGCEENADCVLIGTDCDPFAVHRRYAPRYRKWLGPCTHPAAGGCMGPRGAFCSDGCCDPIIGGLRLEPSPPAKPAPKPAPKPAAKPAPGKKAPKPAPGPPT